VIGAATRLVGLIGDPVAHSLSPRMQNAAFAHLGLDWAYVPLRVDAGALDAALAGLAALSFAGVNVTIPHKEAVAGRCHTLSPVAAACHSVNTVIVQPDGSLHGDSTDGEAVVSGVTDRVGASALSGSALVLGAGGAARAVAAALAAAGMQVAILARRPGAAAALASELSDTGRVEAVAAFPASPPELVVNATPLGGASALTESPLEADALSDVRVVCDLAYRPDARPTPFASAAAALGIAVIDGLEVLARQGAASFRLWTGRDAPLDIMRAALEH
jgi:shikimate dehydrogenase